MRDSKPQRCVLQHKSEKVTENATKRDKHMNEASKQILATISSKSHVNTRKECFPYGAFVSMSSKYEVITNCCVI